MKQMDNEFKESIWRQFGASIDMLENAIQLCPLSSWNSKTIFWYHAFHCLFFLDYYLTMQPQKFSPPAPFTFSEFADELPERVYTREELLNYLHVNREKCRLLIAGLTDGALNARWVNVSGTMNFSVLEILLYNLRHVQHHVAQLNLLLRQDINNAPPWVTQTEHELQADLT
jgi:hypothetical protein